MSAACSNQKAQSLPVRCRCPISCLLLLPPGANEFPSSPLVLPDGPENAGWHGDVKVQQQPVLASGLRMVPFLAGEEHARSSGTLLQGMVLCSLLSHTLSRGWYSDVRGRPEGEPSLLLGVSSAALSWARIVPVLMPTLGVPLESSPLSHRAPDEAHWQQSWGTCCLMCCLTSLPAQRQEQPCCSQELPWLVFPSQARCSGVGSGKASSHIFPEYSSDFQQLAV